MIDARYDALVAKWKRRLDHAEERREPLYIDHEEMNELRAMEDERRRRQDHAALLVEDIARAARIVPEFGHPIVIDVAQRRQQLDALAQTI